MPRTARIQSETGMYHIMVRSIKEIDLFKEDTDKYKYLEIVKKYMLKYGFAVYAYCLMNNHGHFIIDCLGADISKVMQSINLSYAHYYNRKYDRYGPVFQDRFKSKSINSDRYMITLSAYIHNNPRDIKKYENKVHAYPFSSLKEYINKTNKFGILTTSFLASLIGFKYKENRISYLNLVKISNDDKTKIDMEFISDETDYQDHRRIIPRDSKPDQIIEYVAKYLNRDSNDIYMKYRRGCTRIRAISCFLLSTFCNMKQREICEVIGNITQAGVSSLTAKGLDIISREKEIINRFIVTHIIV